MNDQQINKVFEVLKQTFGLTSNSDVHHFLAAISNATSMGMSLGPMYDSALVTPEEYKKNATDENNVRLVHTRHLYGIALVFCYMFRTLFDDEDGAFLQTCIDVSHSINRSDYVEQSHKDGAFTYKEHEMKGTVH